VPAQPQREWARRKHIGHQLENGLKTGPRKVARERADPRFKLRHKKTESIRFHWKMDSGRTQDERFQGIKNKHGKGCVTFATWDSSTVSRQRGRVSGRNSAKTHKGSWRGRTTEVQTRKLSGGNSDACLWGKTNK